MNAAGDPVTEGEFQSALEALREDINAVGTILGDMRERMASIETTCKAAQCSLRERDEAVRVNTSEIDSLKLVLAARKGMERVVFAAIGLGAGIVAAVITAIVTASLVGGSP